MQGLEGALGAILRPCRAAWRIAPFPGALFLAVMGAYGLGRLVLIHARPDSARNDHRRTRDFRADVARFDRRSRSSVARVTELFGDLNRIDEGKGAAAHLLIDQEGDGQLPGAVHVHRLGRVIEFACDGTVRYRRRRPQRADRS